MAVPGEGALLPAPSAIRLKGPFSIGCTQQTSYFDSNLHVQV